MSLEYYLFCRKKYDQILDDLTDMIERYESIIEFNKLKKTHIDKNYYDIFCPVYRNYFIEKRNSIRQKKNICENKILELCNHDFEEDYIDIHPDRSQKITYCKICEYTKN